MGRCVFWTVVHKFGVCYVYIYIYVDVCVCVRVHIHMHIYIYIYIYISIYVVVGRCMFLVFAHKVGVCPIVNIYTYICVCNSCGAFYVLDVCAQVESLPHRCAYVMTNMYIYIYMYVYIHIHIYIHMNEYQ